MGQQKSVSKRPKRAYTCLSKSATLQKHPPSLPLCVCVFSNVTPNFSTFPWFLPKTERFLAELRGGLPTIFADSVSQKPGKYPGHSELLLILSREFSICLNVSNWNEKDLNKRKSDWLRYSVWNKNCLYSIFFCSFQPRGRRQSSSLLKQ